MFEPGPIAITIMLIVTASQALGAYLARPHYREVSRLTDSSLANPDFNGSDMVALKGLLSFITDRRPIWIVAPFAPLLLFVGLWMAIALLFEPRTNIEVARADLDETEELHRRIAMKLGDPDPSAGKFWRSSEWAGINDHGTSAYFLRSPILTAWVVVWLLPGLLLAGVTIGARASFVLARRSADLILATLDRTLLYRTA